MSRWYISADLIAAGLVFSVCAFPALYDWISEKVCR